MNYSNNEKESLFISFEKLIERTKKRREEIKDLKNSLIEVKFENDSLKMKNDDLKKKIKLLEDEYNKKTKREINSQESFSEKTICLKEDSNRCSIIKNLKIIPIIPSYACPQVFCILYDEKIAYSSQGTMIIISDISKTLQEQDEKLLIGHQDLIITICEIYPGFIASGSSDGVVKIWSYLGDIKNPVPDIAEKVNKLFTLSNNRFLSSLSNGKIIIRSSISPFLLIKIINESSMTSVIELQNKEFFVFGNNYKDQCTIDFINNSNYKKEKSIKIENCRACHSIIEIKNNKILADNCNGFCVINLINFTIENTIIFENEIIDSFILLSNENIIYSYQKLQKSGVCYLNTETLQCIEKEEMTIGIRNLVKINDFYFVSINDNSYISLWIYEY